MAAIESGNVAAIATTVGPAMQGARNVQVALAGANANGDDLTRFREEVLRAKAALSAFILAGESARNAVMGRKEYVQMQELQARMSRQSAVDNRAGLILDLLRNVLISHAADPSRDVDRARGNAVSVASFASRLPDQEPNFQFSAISRYCDSGIAPANSNGLCIGVQPAPSWQFIKGKFREQSTFEVTLYAIAPDAGPFVLPVLGMKIRLLPSDQSPEMIGGPSTGGGTP